MEQQTIHRNKMIAELVRSEHGKLAAYVPVVSRASQEDPDFLAHLIAWNQKKGSIRDSKIALPMIQLGATAELPEEYTQNDLAHVALQSPRELLRAVRFSREYRPRGRGKRFESMVERYLRKKEAQAAGRFFQLVLQHRKPLKELYALLHIKPNELANRVLFKGEKPGVLGRVARLGEMAAEDAAAVIMRDHIPFLVAAPVIAKHKGNTAFVLALIEAMTPAELVNNTKMLEKLGIRNVPALRAAFDAKLREAVESKKNVLKTAKAAEATGNKKLAKAAEKQLDNTDGVQGDWLVLGDCSGSMSIGIEAARQVSAILARMVRGKVHLVFFNSMPRHFDVTGKTFEEITEITRGIRDGGGTSIGVGLAWARTAGIPVDGVAIISDGEENTNPVFHDELKKYQEWVGKEIPVYYYAVGGRFRGKSFLEMSMERSGFDLQTFDLKGSAIDYYSLPNLVQTMRTNKYSLSDEIFATPLLTLDEVFA